MALIVPWFSWAAILYSTYLDIYFKHIVQHLLLLNLIRMFRIISGTRITFGKTEVECRNVQTRSCDAHNWKWKRTKSKHWAILLLAKHPKDVVWSRERVSAVEDCRFWCIFQVFLPAKRKIHHQLELSANFRPFPYDFGSISWIMIDANMVYYGIIRFDNKPKFSSIFGGKHHMHIRYNPHPIHRMC